MKDVEAFNSIDDIKLFFSVWELSRGVMVVIGNWIERIYNEVLSENFTVSYGLPEDAMQPCIVILISIVECRKKHHSYFTCFVICRSSRA